ncbi:MAG TPA: NAD(P)H-hydrate dehydratase [Thermoplasmata archaeon]|nr:NAD(P)H-hydrate dehydratase [Thermoplasmata archaeon]
MWAASPRPLTAGEALAVEVNAVALGVSIDALMENAGRAVAEEATHHLPPAPARVAVVASTGNNGGDGTCAAFYLHQWGYSPEVWLLRPPLEIRSRSARRCFERVEHRVPVHLRAPRPDELASMPLVLDALLGSGQAGQLRSPVREAVDAIRASGAPVLSVDLPTGTRDPHGVRATWTVTLTAPKQEMDPATAGEVVVRDIGIPEDAWRRTGPGEFAFFRSPTGVSDRGRSARVVIIGGGPYAGAPALAALAALRAGAERATVFAPKGAAELVQGFSPNLVVRAFGSGRFAPVDVAELVAAVRSSAPAAVAVGMGAGAAPETVEALRGLQRELAGTVPLVVDADGLLALPTPDELDARTRPVVAATPNAGEFARLFAPGGADTAEARRAAVVQGAAAGRLLLVAKGQPDLISDGESLAENHHHHPAMTVGGVGDVLAGVLASLLGSGLEPFPAGRLATYWVGEAGIVAASRRSFGLTATDVIEELPGVLATGLARARHAA